MEHTSPSGEMEQGHNVWSHSQAYSAQVPITDMYGPTAWDADLQCLVVTTDTARGGDKVNEERKQKVSFHFSILIVLMHTFYRAYLLWIFIWWS